MNKFISWQSAIFILHFTIPAFYTAPIYSPLYVHSCPCHYNGRPICRSIHFPHLWFFCDCTNWHFLIWKMSTVLACWLSRSTYCIPTYQNYFRTSWLEVIDVSASYIHSNEDLSVIIHLIILSSMISSTVTVSWRSTKNVGRNFVSYPLALFHPLSAHVTDTQTERHTDRKMHRRTDGHNKSPLCLRIIKNKNSFRDN